MKKVLLIARTKTKESLLKAESFADRVRQRLDSDFQIETAEITDLFFELDEKNLKIYHPDKKFDLKDFDLVIIRRIGTMAFHAHAIALYCEKFNIKYTDQYLNRLLLDNKLSTEFLLWCNDLKKWPRTFFGNNKELARRMPELGDRAVMKDNVGAKGRLNFVVKSPSEVETIHQENPDIQFVLQEFIPNDSDLRVLVMNDKVKLVIRRSSTSDSHLNNTSQGGRAEIIPIDSVDAKILKDCIKAAKVSKLQVAGVDIMQDLNTGEYYFLEINNAPQISSGSFTDEKADVYAEMIKDITTSKDSTSKDIVGINEFITINDVMENIPAKIDTGADSSAIWASDIRVDEDGVLLFKLFGEGSEFYSGEDIRVKDFSVAKVRSTTGHQQIRYRTHFSVKIGGRRVKMLMNLSDRSKNKFPVLIGRRSIAGKFLVDVSKKNIKIDKSVNTNVLNQELLKNPYEFYKKYHQEGVDE